MVDFDDPYLEVQMRGRVVERHSDPELRHFDAMSLKYVGKSWPYRDEESPIVLIIGLAKVRYSFPTNRGICFSLKANRNRWKR